MKRTIKTMVRSNTLFRSIFVVLVLLSAIETFAQVPQLFNYQGIARDVKGNPLGNTTMSIKLSVLPTSDASVAEYEEIQTVKTNEFGLYTLQIGNGSAISGKTLKEVKWESGSKYIKVAIDPSGGNNYVDAGTNQLLSVPYAIYADKAGVAAHAGTDKTRTGAVNSEAAHVAGDNRYLTRFYGLNLIGKSALYESAAGNIGLGTTAPGAKFAIYANTATNVEHLRLQNVSATGSGKFIMYNDGLSSYATFTKYGSAATGDQIPGLYPNANTLAFGNNGTAAGDGLGRFLISTGGNLGLAILKGSSKLKFHVDYTTENVGIGGNAVPAARVHLMNTDDISMEMRLTNNITGHTLADGLEIGNFGTSAGIYNRENNSLTLGVNSNPAMVTITPSGTTEFSGQVQIAGGAPGIGKFLMSDAVGLATWENGPVGAQGPQGPQGIQGNDGPQGPQGPQGIQGPAGPAGPTGPQGPMGIQGFAGPAGGMGAAGPQGPAGPSGSNGLDGKTILNGTNAPTVGVGVDGDFYINTIAHQIYGPKIGGAWGSPTSIIGPAGPAGPQGPTGVAGATGPQGPIGLTGPQGAQGPAGPTGPQGPAGAGLPNGAAAGNTPYWNGASWVVNSSNIFNNGGNVGIGNVAPGAKLEVTGQVKITGGAPGAGKVLTSDATGLATWQTATGGMGGSGTLNFIPKFTPNGTTLGNSTISDNAGKVVIGTVASTPGAYKLYVQSGILTERLKVAVNGSGNWADYVFADTYKLLPLEEVEAFIKENKHLPNVPSAEKMVETGIDVATVDAKLMEKLEELTLYMIEMNKEIKALKSENEVLKATLKK